MEVVPNERMRIWMTKDSHRRDREFCLFHVFLKEELRDIMIGLSIYNGRYGPYRVSGMSAVITLHPGPVQETPKQKQIRENQCLDPLLKLYFLSDVETNGISYEKSRILSKRLCRQEWDRTTVHSTFQELFEAGEQARVSGQHIVASTYYNRAMDYVKHFDEEELDVFSNPLVFDAFKFKVDLQRSRNWIEEGNLDDAHKSAIAATSNAVQLLPQLLPKLGPAVIGPGVLPSDVKSRNEPLQIVRAKLANFGHRVKAEEIGDAYFSKAIVGSAIGKSNAEHTANDEEIGFLCYEIADTASNDRLHEFLARLRETVKVHAVAYEQTQTAAREEEVIDNRGETYSSDDDWEDID